MLTFELTNENVSTVDASIDVIANEKKKRSDLFIRIDFILFYFHFLKNAFNFSGIHRIGKQNVQ